MKLQMHYDPEADYLEVRIGPATPSYYEDIDDDTFERHDEKTGNLTGYSLFSVKKRKETKDIVIDLSQLRKARAKVVA
ncbi:MAG: DUF2283 domain-containing protein [Candidatus Woesearchaeota archaeon]|nr:DUF2283 domain-containing protein [Candidatus Woesearchaeota archaeon]